MFHCTAEPLTSPLFVHRELQATTIKLAPRVNGDNSQNAQASGSATHTYLCVDGSMFVFQLSSPAERLNQMLNLVRAY